MTTRLRFLEEGQDLLKQYAERYFALHLKKEDGTSEADSLNRALDQIANRKGPTWEAKRVEIEGKLTLPDFPEEYTDTWKVFGDLHAQRGSSGFGSNPISYSEIDAYIRLTRRVLLSYEVDGITIIDGAYLTAQSNLAKAAKATSKPANLPQQASAPPRKAPARR